MSDESNVAQIERRLHRERQARKEAERLLSEKSIALYNALHESEESKKRLELALWASQESYWEWHAVEDRFLIRSFSLKNDIESVWEGAPVALLSLIHEDDIGSLEFQWAIAMQGGRDQIEFTFRFKQKKRYQWMRMRGRVLARDNFGSALHIVGTTKDITQQRQAEQSFHLMASAFSSSREPMLVLSDAYRITECNDAFLQLFKAEDKSYCYGLSLASLIDFDLAAVTTEEQPDALRFETELLISNESRVPVDVSLANFRARRQDKAYVIATLRDISERVKNEDKLKQLALFDDLTSLYNRNGLKQALNRLADENDAFTLLFIDLDGFKQINDGAGHKQGDECLVSVARTLQRRCYDSTVISRWGGDEFVLVMPATSAGQACSVGEEIIADIEAASIRVGETELRLSASIGVAEFPLHGETVDVLLQNADAAMYQAKMSGKGQLLEYRQGLAEKMKAQVSMLSELRRAVDNRRLDFYLQGKFDINGYLRGAELLCRWNSAIHGAVPPDVFISLAEQYQLDSAIGLLALEAACDYIIAMDYNGFNIPLSVNVSVNQLLDEAFPQQATAICKENGVVPSMIEIELTESIFMRDERRALNALTALRKAGFRLSLDDFGSGFSSLGYLRKFDFEVVKLDRGLIKNIHDDSRALSLFRGVVAMLNALQLEVVVEGVETLEYLMLLKEENISLLQGYYFEKPMAYEVFMAKHCSGAASFSA